MKLISIFAGAVALVSSLVFADEKLVIVNTASNSGQMITMARAFEEDLKKLGYGTEIVSPGNNCQANGIYRSIPTDQPVLINLDSFSQADPMSGKIDGCEAVMPTADDLLWTYLDHMHLCTFNQKDNPTAIFNKGSQFRVGVTPPAHVFENLVGGINSENGTDHKRVQYKGSGDVRSALINGEVDYSILSTKHSKRVMSKGAVCVAEFTKHQTLMGLPKVSELSAGNGEFDTSFSTVWALKNSSPESVEKMRKIMYDLLHDMNSAIIAERGGKTPDNYMGWDKSYAERAQWMVENTKRLAGVE